MLYPHRHPDRADTPRASPRGSQAQRRGARDHARAQARAGDQVRDHGPITAHRVHLLATIGVGFNDSTSVARSLREICPGHLIVRKRGSEVSIGTREPVEFPPRGGAIEAAARHAREVADMFELVDMRYVYFGQCIVRTRLVRGAA